MSRDGLAASLDRVLEHRGLADARLSVHHQDAAVPAARGLEQPVEHGTLAVSSDQVLSPDRRRLAVREEEICVDWTKTRRSRP